MLRSPERTRRDPRNMSIQTEFAAGAPSAAKKWVGTSVLRHEDSRLLTGHGCFVDDIKLSNLHHAAILRSPYAHARIKSVDLSKALQLPGVVGGITGQDVKRQTKPFSVVGTAP